MNYRIIDADTHVTEPADVWTSRVPARWKQHVPHVVLDPATGDQVWMLGDQRMSVVGITAVAGWPDPYPAHPKGYDDAHPGSYDARARLEYMDGLGVWAQVLYPNVGGFGNQAFLKIPEADLKLACVRAYNDFLAEWSREDSRRLIPVAATPFWDVLATAAEIERCAALGHRGVLFTGEPQVFGLPPLYDRHWDPLWSAAVDANLPISFHIGSADLGQEFLPERVAAEGVSVNSARVGSKLFLANGGHMLDLLFSGVLARYPELRVVSVESGAGWVPFVLQSADYQYERMAVRKEHPELALRPSEYFRRQVYACCWFEHVPEAHVVERVGADRILFETDFPHPTSIYGPDVPDTIERGLGHLAPDVQRRILWSNTAELYGIEAPPA
jgi:predicted TIM-barrel fold metal-dependent hydrolase